MVWDAVVKERTANIIAKVEGAGAWDAINYNDACTAGLMQWWGTRCLGLFVQIKADHPDLHAGLPSDFKAKVDANNPRDPYWTTESIRMDQGPAIKVALRGAHDSQSTILSNDLDDYLSAAAACGLNKDTQTHQTQFFMVMWHQNPKRARNLVLKIGASSTLERLYKACLNEESLGRYKTRYTTAYDYIRTNTAPNILSITDDGEDNGDDGSSTETETSTGEGGSLLDPAVKGATRVSIVGNELAITNPDGSKTFAYGTQGNDFIVTGSVQGEEAPPATPAPDESDPTPDPDPDPPTGNEATDKQNAIVKFMTSRVGRYRYSQGPSRLTPEKNMYTDCSGLVRFAYLSVMGVDVGTYTDAQLSSSKTRIITSGGGGNSPNESLMKKGDLVISRRYGTAANRSASHVEIYMGNGQIVGHGGPMNGPIVKNLAARTADKQRWWVKRLKQW